LGTLHAPQCKTHGAVVWLSCGWLQKKVISEEDSVTVLCDSFPEGMRRIIAPGSETGQITTRFVAKCSHDAYTLKQTKRLYRFFALDSFHRRAIPVCAGIIALPPKDHQGIRGAGQSAKTGTCSYYATLFRPDMMYSASFRVSRLLTQFRFCFSTLVGYWSSYTGHSQRNLHSAKSWCKTLVMSHRGKTHRERCPQCKQASSLGINLSWSCDPAMLVAQALLTLLYTQARLL
jgi:hypothetical protein